MSTDGAFPRFGQSFRYLTSGDAFQKQPRPIDEKTVYIWITEMQQKKSDEELEAVSNGPFMASVRPTKGAGPTRAE